MKRTISIIAVLALLIQIQGCSTRKVHQVSSPDLQHPATDKIVGITTTAGEHITFRPPGASVGTGKLKAKVAGKQFEIPLDQIERYWIEKKEFSKIRTISLVAGIAAIVAIGVLGRDKDAEETAEQESCPFIYSWDGQQYVFDSEPYGGATSRGLERDDYSELRHLVSDKGTYRLMVSNEIQETQHTNLMEIIVADHRADRVAMNDSGKLYTLASIQPPASATDEAGHDLLPWLEGTDKRIWEPTPETDPAARVRNEMRLSFPKPLSTSRVKLLVNAATSLWGSYMIKELLALHGSDVDAWYALIDNNPIGRTALRAWNEREELLMLKIDVEEPEGWVQRGLLLGGGPFVLENRVVDLDISRVKGNRLNIRMRPPKGFWAFNSFAVDYTPNEEIDVQTLHPIECRDSTGRDRLEQITNADDSYYDMPAIGDRGFLSFRAPSEKPGMKRTIFLHTRGYYQIHLHGLKGADADMLSRIAAIPDEAARFSGLRFAARQRAQQAQR